MESSAPSTHKKLKEISTKRKNVHTIFDACQNVVDLVGREFREHTPAFFLLAQICTRRTYFRDGSCCFAII